MKNTIKKPKIYFLMALLVAIVSLFISIIFIIQAIRIEGDSIIAAVLFLPPFFLSIYFIILYFKWKIVFEGDKIIFYKPFHLPKIYNKEEVTITQKSFLWEFGALRYKNKKIAKISIYDVNNHLTGYLKWKK